MEGEYSYAIMRDPKTGQQAEMTTLVPPTPQGNYVKINMPALPADKHPHDRLCWTIFNLILGNICCALPALFYTIRTRDMKQEGNFKKAQKYSRRSCCCNFFATFSTVIMVLVLIGFLVAGGAVLTAAIEELIKPHHVNSYSSGSL